MKTFALIVMIMMGFAAAMLGCGEAPETTYEDMESNPPVSMTARLQYQVDSLMNENRRLQQQIDAMGTENRNLTARSAELETRINEMAASPRVETAPPPPSGTATGYDEGLDAFHRRDFTGAIRTFQSLLDGNVRETLADNCQYWMGESYYGMKQYREAIERFEMVLNHKDSEKKDDAQLMIANAKAAMGDKAGAREAYNTLISSYPTSPLVGKARERLARLR